MAFHKPMQYPDVPASKANQDAPINAPVGLNGFLEFSLCFMIAECSSVLCCNGSMLICFSG